MTLKIGLINFLPGATCAEAFWESLKQEVYHLNKRLLPTTMCHLSFYLNKIIFHLSFYLNKIISLIILLKQKSLKQEASAYHHVSINKAVAFRAI